MEAAFWYFPHSTYRGKSAPMNHDAPVRLPSLVVLTGAGVSADSGVSTFRDPQGLWAKYDLAEVATPEGFAANPDKVHEFYNLRRAALPTVDPNPAHFALAALEAKLSAAGGRFTLITQNVDNLHARASSHAILPMHGALDRVWCTACDVHFDWAEAVSVMTPCPGCGAAGDLRPDIVWFGEMPHFLDEIDEAIAGASHFVAIGTSGTVYPAAGLVEAASHAGVHTTELNLEPSANAARFSDRRYGPARDVVPAWVASFSAAHGL